MELKNSRIIVTGGSSGIGKATAHLLSQAGAKVVITGRNEEKLNAVANEIGATALPFDISDYNSIPKKVEDAVSVLGGIDVIVNNAGIGTFPEMGEITIADFEKVYSTNVFGLALFTQEIIKHFKSQESGDIVNIASTAAVRGFAKGTIYSSSKFALRGMTQCWQAELRPFNIRAILVNPSEVTTAFNQENRIERPEEPQKLRPIEIAHSIKAVLEMDNRGFIPELTVWATNPWKK